MSICLGGGMARYIPDTPEQAVAELLAGTVVCRFRDELKESIDMDFNGITKKDWETAQSFQKYFDSLDWNEVIMKFKKEVVK
jgi:hypothetical protein